VRARGLSAALTAVLTLAAGPLAALDLALPAGARLTAERLTEAGSYAVPTGPWREGSGVPVQLAEGRVLRQAYRIDSSDLTTLQVLAPLRTQLEQAGYSVLLDCVTGTCGGFDFRFGIEVMTAPDMYVDLTAYRFLSAEGPEGDFLTLLVSRSAAASFVQLVRANGPEPAPEDPGPVVSPGPAGAPAAATATPEQIAARLEQRGYVVLRDLSFATGEADLGETEVASLEALASYLKDNPARRLLFVGHTDATGSLEANRALSQRRASAALAYLRDRHGIPSARMAADGAGYLAPVASNLTQEGREANRRIEAVLLEAEG
jgi:OmpA-OmpF porin, OOP family